MERDNSLGCAAVHELASQLYNGDTEEEHTSLGALTFSLLDGHHGQCVDDFVRGEWSMQGHAHDVLQTEKTTPICYL